MLCVGKNCLILCKTVVINVTYEITDKKNLFLCIFLYLLIYKLLFMHFIIFLVIAIFNPFNLITVVQSYDTSNTYRPRFMCNTASSQRFCKVYSLADHFRSAFNVAKIHWLRRLGARALPSVLVAVTSQLCGMLLRSAWNIPCKTASVQPFPHTLNSNLNTYKIKKIFRSKSI